MKRLSRPEHVCVSILLKDIAELVSIKKNENDCGVIIKEMTVWGLMCDENNWHSISIDAITRIRRLREILKPCMDHRQRQSLRMTVEAIWQALGGPGCMSPVLKDEDYMGNNLDDAMIYLDYLEDQEEAGDIQDLASFEKGLNAL